MHCCGQIKTVPVCRIHHATHETIHPLTRADIDVHGEGSVVFPLSYADQSVKGIKRSLKSWSLARRNSTQWFTYLCFQNLS